MKNIFFNAHHAPVGSFASFTLGFPGPNGGLGLELGKPAGQKVYIGAETRKPGAFAALPFFDVPAENESARYEVETGGTQGAAKKRVRAFEASKVRRDFHVATDTWAAGDLTFRIVSPVRGIPDPAAGDSAELKLVLLPAVVAALTLDNRRGRKPRKAFFGFAGNDPYTQMRRVDDTTDGALKGVAQGRHVAIVSADEFVSSGLGFTIESILAPTIAENLSFGLGGVGALWMTVPAGETRTARFAICFFRGGMVTAGLDTRYFYTRFYENIEAVGRHALANFGVLERWAAEADKRLDHSALSADQKFMLAHAIRSYYGSTELLDHADRAVWVVNEGEYRMMNTFDLTADLLFHEMAMNPWTVRNVLDLFVDRYSYRDRVRFPGDAAEHAGGISFTHDMGVANTFSRPGHSTYERSGLDGCFSHMTHEQLVNWVCCASVYVARSGDAAWRDRRRQTFLDSLESLVNRDHPDPAQRDGVMSLDSSRTAGGAEITTYDSLDSSLGQARNNLYLAVKTWAAYVCLERAFGEMGAAAQADESRAQAGRCAATLVKHVTAQGYIPAIIDEPNDSRIIPAIEGLVFPYVCGYRDAVALDGPYGDLLRVLRGHLGAVLVKGVCLFDGGAWKMSSTSNNSWLSKTYLCQFVARQILGLRDHRGHRADAAHVAWLLHPELSYWGWSDQIVSGRITGSRYYPRGVTAVLWLDEDGAAAPAKSRGTGGVRRKTTGPKGRANPR